MMGGLRTMGGASALPSPALLESAIRRLSREQLADLCEQLIDRMDAMDPESDLEWNGDELDGNLGEDDFHPQNEDWKGEPGCPISDPDSAVDDRECDEDCELEHDYRCQPVPQAVSRCWGGGA